MKSTILELAGLATIAIGLALIEPLSLIVFGGIVLVALGYSRGDKQ
jgi:hypothetical protein